MTEAEQDATLGRLVREYKATRELIACLSSSVRSVARDLGDIDKLLYSADKESQLLAVLKAINLDFVATVTSRIPELQDALRRKEDLQTRLINMGYRDFV
ncbi:MAG: hypothetical protein OXG11_04655 [Chloroflexi bacterium]|nr:hypothetical protein [Chloroflexota bacterium]